VENEFEVYKRRVLEACEVESSNPILKEQIELRAEFVREYPISRLETMELDEYVIGTASEDSFCYKLEFGKYKDVGLGIGGGSAAKYGVYYSKTENSYRIRDRGVKTKAPEDPDAFWELFRAQLVGFLKEIGEPGFSFDYNLTDKYPMLTGMGIVLDKLCFMYYPELFTNMSHWVSVTVLKKLGVNNPDQYDRVRMAFVAHKLLEAKIPELYDGRYDPQLVGNAIFKVFREDLDKENSELVDAHKTSAEDESETEIERKTGGENVIYYGTPGCGKSYEVNKKYGSKDFGYAIRTVFHPDYTNSDFVGQVVPAVSNDGKVSYRLAPGPFTRALQYAVKHPNERVALIIDEINRGNAAAIFGDILQLLDRDEFGAGQYAISNDFISSYFSRFEREIPDISLPSNLWIVATMNTSDQNVFTLDTAFKRRWKLVRIRNSFDVEGARAVRNLYVPGTSCKWSEFVTKVNDRIVRTESFGLNSEDKQLGVFFMPRRALAELPNEEDAEKISEFGEKILMYLWEDVAKMDRAAWFGEEYHTLDQLLDDFANKRLDVINITFKTNDGEADKLL